MITWIGIWDLITMILSYSHNMYCKYYNTSCEVWIHCTRQSCKISNKFLWANFTRNCRKLPCALCILQSTYVGSCENAKINRKTAKLFSVEQQIKSFRGYPMLSFYLQLKAYDAVMDRLAEKMENTSHTSSADVPSQNTNTPTPTLIDNVPVTETSAPGRRRRQTPGKILRSKYSMCFIKGKNSPDLRAFWSQCALGVEILNHIFTRC